MKNNCGPHAVTLSIKLSARPFITLLGLGVFDIWLTYWLIQLIFIDNCDQEC